MEEKFYLTKKGLHRIQQEYQSLLGFKASKTKDEAPTMWHSEEVNPEYLIYQEDMSLLDARLAEYEHILKNAVLIQPPKKEHQNVIHIGATVKCEVDEKIDEFTIVGSLESNPSLGKISDESPVGKALMGKKNGEIVVVNSAVKVTYKIQQITY